MIVNLYTVLYTAKYLEKVCKYIYCVIEKKTAGKEMKGNDREIGILSFLWS